MERPYSVLGAIVYAIPQIAIGTLPASVSVLAPTSNLWAMLIMGAAGIPFGVWLPIARVGSMGKSWKVPSRTLLLPRWLVGLIGTCLLGETIALLVLTGWTDGRYGFLFAMQTCCTIAFLISAQRRFSRHRSSEFAMPFPCRLP